MPESTTHWKDSVRADAEAWLEEHWDPNLSVEEWWELVGDAGWTAPHFTPEQGGRGLHRSSPVIVRRVFHEFGALRPPGGLGLLMAAPTILTHGTEDQIERHVRPILTGRTNWCQLFSEPGNGSDLAGLTTRAERDGDRWIINGQKVWSSMAMQADYGMLLARTDFSVPKHAGISWFAFDMNQPGVTIRPLREMTGQAVFNEVFLDDAVCEHADLIGDEGDGWSITQTTLLFERTGLASGAHANFPEGGPKGGFIGRQAADAALDEVPVNDLVVRFTDLRQLARDRGRTDDPFIRQQLARLYTMTKLGRWNGDRARTLPGGGALATTGKLASTHETRFAAALGMEILGIDGMLAAPDGAEGGRFSNALVFSPASGIYGGTDEIQRNIIAERALGLPRDHLPGKGEPYGQFLRSLRRSD